MHFRSWLVIALAGGFMYSGASTMALAADVLRAPASGVRGFSLMTLVWMVIAIGILTACGLAIIPLVSRGTRLYWHERWAAAWMIGCGVGASAWFVFMPLYHWVSPIVLLTSLMLAASAQGARSLQPPRGARLEWSPGGTEKSKPVDVLLAVVLAVQIAVLFLAACWTPLGWDGVFNFEIKARLAFEHTPAGQLPLSYFSDPAQKDSHPHYPLLVPFTEFWIYTWLGRVDQSAVKILFPLFYLSLIGFVAGAVRRVADRRTGMIAAVALGLLPPLTFIPGAASGYADVPLAAAVAGATSFALVGIVQAKRDAYALSAALLAVAVWTKSEGILFALAVCAFTTAVKPVRALIWLAPVIAALPWIAFQVMYGQRGGDFQSVTGPVFVENLDRLPTVAMLVTRELIRPGHWALLFPVFFYLLAMAAKRRPRLADALFAAIVVAPLAIYALMYVFSAWPDMREHVGTSLSRVMVPLAPLALIFIIRQLRSDPSLEVREWA